MDNLSINKGKFTFKGNEYLFSKFENNDGELVDYSILSETQTLVGTNKGILLFSCQDTKVSMIVFNNIEDWLTKLYSKN